MEEFDIYKDISERTNGDIYIGVVGPVRAGKSTFITRFMEKLVVPKIKSKPIRDRMTDELPQSANGKTIMTTQPKFVPGEAVSIKIADKFDVKVRLVDCVGYLIEGANGHLEADKPRMVKTPWSDEAMPFERAAEIGTKKVINDHSTIGIVMTSDGSIDTEIARTSYVAAEERVVSELRELKKPFVVILNSRAPGSAETVKLGQLLCEKYGVPVIPMDVLNFDERDVLKVFEGILMEFPLKDIEVKIDKWLQALPAENEIITCLITRLMDCAGGMNKMADYAATQNMFAESEYFERIEVTTLDMGVGKVVYTVSPKPELFYRAMSSACGMEIGDDFTLMAYMKEMTHAKREYDKLRAALDEVRRTGYGVVSPSLDEMTLEEPQIVKQGNRFGVKLKASAPSLHIMQVDINAEVSPIMGTEQQSEEMITVMLKDFEEDPKRLWNTDMFGKSLHMLVNESLNNKLAAMPNETQKKMRRTLTRIVNEGKGGIICILL
jgi:stage IV sporulation protein A